MNLLQVNYDGKENPKDITVNMSISEATALVNLLGQMNGHAHEKLQIDSSMYDCLSGVFNRHFDDGAPTLNFELPTLNVDTSK